MWSSLFSEIVLLHQAHSSDIAHVRAMNLAFLSGSTIKMHKLRSQMKTPTNHTSASVNTDALQAWAGYISKG